MSDKFLWLALVCGIIILFTMLFSFGILMNRISAKYFSGTVIVFLVSFIFMIAFGYDSHVLSSKAPSANEIYNTVFTTKTKYYNDYETVKDNHKGTYYLVGGKKYYSDKSIIRRFKHVPPSNKSTYVVVKRPELKKPLSGHNKKILQNVFQSDINMSSQTQLASVNMSFTKCLHTYQDENTIIEIRQ